MENTQKILSEITNLTRKIETDYPELYQYLDENPMTVPAQSDPSIDNKILQKYLESLRQLIKNHIESRKIIEK
ncbi:MAG: hypothetical protein RQ864_04130 [Lutibacter sp.]|nr:hypothetical protein [Lutibacter sp.]